MIFIPFYRTKASLYFLICLVLLILCASIPNVASAKWWNPFAPETLEECILKNMRGVTSDTAAVAIQNACLMKHNQEEDKTLRAAFVDGACNFTWNGFQFEPKVQRKENGYSAFEISQNAGMSIVMWFAESLARDWGKQKPEGATETVNALFQTHHSSMEEQCKKMILSSAK